MTTTAITEVPRAASLVAKARDLVAEAKSVAEAKAIRDELGAIAYYARERGESEALVQEATEAKLWCERRIGELTAAMPKRAPGRRGELSPPGGPISKCEALAAAGLTKQQASRWERLARMTEDAFIELLAAAGHRARGEKKASPSLQVRRTPAWLFAELSELFGPFVCDAYADQYNALCTHFYTKADDGNRQPWPPGTFWNPEFEDMWTPVSHALEEAERGNWSIGLGPVGCSQAWYHKLAIRGTIYVPDRRICYDLPDGTPTDGADRDTIVMGFGGPHRNPNWQREFRVLPLPLKGPVAGNGQG